MPSCDHRRAREDVGVEEAAGAEGAVAARARRRRVTNEAKDEKNGEII